jgi:hypothetical protein
MAQVLEVIDGGACWGQLQNGDSISKILKEMDAAKSQLGNNDGIHFEEEGVM